MLHYLDSKNLYSYFFLPIPKQNPQLTKHSQTQIETLLPLLNFLVANPVALN